MDDVAQRRRVETAPLVLRQGQQSHELRRHQVGDRDAVALDQLQRPLGLEAVHDHQRVAQVHRTAKP